MPNQIKYPSDDHITITNNNCNVNNSSNNNPTNSDLNPNSNIINCNNGKTFVSVTQTAKSPSPTGLNAFKFNKGGASVTVTNNSRSPSLSNYSDINNCNPVKLNTNNNSTSNNSIIFLGDCEMPITKRDDSKKSDYASPSDDTKLIINSECGKSDNSHKMLKNQQKSNNHKSSTSGDSDGKNYASTNHIR